MSVTGYDYVVVGGGTAGCVVATRLSEDPAVSVLLLEAGGDERRPDVEDPEIWETLLGTDADWGYETVPQPGTGRVHAAPRGKVLGGSGSINCLAHLRGHRRDFEEWAALGADGWDYAGVLPYFKRSEDVPDGDPRYRGRGGPLRPRTPGVDVLGAAWADGARQLGHAAVGDFNGAEMIGVGPTDMLIRDGRRESTATAYLRPAAGRPNLTIATDALARRLLVERGRCTGVEYLRDGALERATASAEVILCAGAIGSPHLLMVSGIGPAAELEAAGVAPLLDLPGVGRDLQDHILLAGIRYRAERPLPSGGGDGTTLLATLDGGDHGPDVHLNVMNIDYHLDGQGPLPGGFTFGVGQMRPRSRGSVRLTSADPAVAPLVDPGYLRERADLDQLVAAIELVEQIVATGVFADWGGESTTTAMLALERPQLERAVKEAVSSYFHLAGTCRMGSDAAAVLDPRLRVNGIAGLRVADCSAMPVVVSCNTNAAAVMIGEKAADLVRGRVLRDDAHAPVGTA